ncbi:MAG: hypothetical protein ACHQIG_06945 [Acidimicrobiia bacterium]
MSDAGDDFAAVTGVDLAARVTANRSQTDDGESVTSTSDGFSTRRTAWRDRLAGVLAAVALPWALSRLLAAAVVAVAPSYPFGDGLKLTGFWYRWDGGHYVAIAREGYGLVETAFPRWAFFPGLPGILRALGTIGTNADTIGLFVIDQIALLAALAGLFVLARRHVNGEAALVAVWLLAFFPASFVFSMGYPSALFLASTVWAFVLVEDRYDLAAGLLAAGASILRPNGLIVVIALVVAVRTFRRAVVVAAPGAIAVGAWLLVCLDRTGDAFVFWTVKSHWQEIGLVDVVRGTVKWSLLPHVALALVALVAVVVERRRLPLAWLVLTALYLLMPLATGMVGLGRYANECFPPFVAMGAILQHRARWLTVAAVVVCAIGMVLFGFVVGRYGLVP